MPFHFSLFGVSFVSVSSIDILPEIATDILKLFQKCRDDDKNRDGRNLHSDGKYRQFPNEV